MNNRFLRRQDRRCLRSNATSWLARSRNNEWAQHRGATRAPISRVTFSLAGSGDRHTKLGGSDVCPSLIERIPEHDDHHLLRSRVRDLCTGNVSVSPESDVERWLTRSASFGQMKLSSLLALDADHRAIGDFHVGLPIQRHPNRKAAGRIVSKDLNATNGLTARPLSNGVQAFFSERRVGQSDCLRFSHAAQGPGPCMA